MYHWGSGIENGRFLRGKISEKTWVFKESVENCLNGIFGCQKFHLNSSDRKMQASKTFFVFFSSAWEILFGGVEKYV